MNNLLVAFSIKVEGQHLDDKEFNQYTDYDPTDLEQMTDEESIEKAKAYVRMKHLKRCLSDYAVPVYHKVFYGTEGTAKEIPTDAEIVVGYVSAEAFLSQVIDEYKVEDDGSDNKKELIETFIKEHIEKILDSELVEFGTHVKTLTRNVHALKDDENKYRLTTTEYLTVPAVKPTVTVKLLDIKA